MDEEELQTEELEFVDEPTTNPQINNEEHFLARLDSAFHSGRIDGILDTIEVVRWYFYRSGSTIEEATETARNLAFKMGVLERYNLSLQDAQTMK